MPTQPLVSVLVPAYNQERFLAETLESILAQDYRPLEIIVSDDASTDSTATIAREYARKYPDIVRVQQHPLNLGPTGNVRSALPLVRGKYLSWFSGDDLFLPGKISKQVKALQDNPDAVFCFHDLEVFDDATGKTAYRFNDAEAGMPVGALDRVAEDLLERRCFIAAASLLVDWSRTSHIAHRPEVSRISDWLYIIELAHFGPCVFLAEPLARYRRHENNLSRTLDVIDEYRVYDFVEQTYTQYARAVTLGRIRVDVSFTCQFLLARRWPEAWRTTRTLARTLARRPADIRVALSVLADLLKKRFYLLRSTGRLRR